MHRHMCAFTQVTGELLGSEPVRRRLGVEPLAYLSP